jgi:hypothetical protein
MDRMRAPPQASRVPTAALKFWPKKRDPLHPARKARNVSMLTFDRVG